MEEFKFYGGIIHAFLFVEWVIHGHMMTLVWGLSSKWCYHFHQQSQALPEPKAQKSGGLREQGDHSWKHIKVRKLLRFSRGPNIYHVPFWVWCWTCCKINTSRPGLHQPERVEHFLVIQFFSIRIYWATQCCLPWKMQKKSNSWGYDHSP